MTGRETLNKVIQLEKDSGKDRKRQALQIKTACLRELWKQGGGRNRFFYYVALERVNNLLQ